MTFHSLQDDSHLYFITASIVGWLQIFREPAYAKIVVDSLAWLRVQKHMELYAFALMPSHLHVLIKPTGLTIGQWLQKFGSFTAHAVLNQASQDEKVEWLRHFQQKKRDNARRYSIWQDIQAKNVFSREFLIQKLEYTHNNPINKEWRLVDDRADYKLSSACFYDRDEIPVIQIDDVRVWL